MSYKPGKIAMLKRYGDLHWYLASGHPAKRKKLENNSYVYIDENDKCAIVITLHQTDIMRLYPNGDIKLDTGGWATQTTRNRFNQYTPEGFDIHQDRRVWIINWPGGQGILQKEVYFKRLPDLKTYEATFAYNMPSERKVFAELRKKIKNYAKEFIEALQRGAVDKNIECQFCTAMSESTVHLLGHMDNHEYIPALIGNALELFKANKQEKFWVNARLLQQEVPDNGLWHMRKEYIETILQKYLCKQFNLPF
jgi:hypothetical protein